MFSRRQFNDDDLRILARDIMALHVKGQWPPMFPQPDDDIFPRYQRMMVSAPDRAAFETICHEVHSAEPCKRCEAEQAWRLAEQRQIEHTQLRPFIAFLETIDA